MARDSRRGAVYAAEQQVQRLLDRAREYPTVVLAGSTVTIPAERHFGDLESIQRYVDKVLALTPVRDAWPGRAALPVRVRRRAGDRKAHYERTENTIAIPDNREGRWSMRELIVLHELSHHLAGPGVRHLREFQSTMAALCSIAVAPEMGLILRVAYHDTGADQAQ